MKHQASLLPLKLGDRLRTERQNQGFSYLDVQQSLNLMPEVIRKMEANQWEQLAAVYRQGYAKRYAEFLGIEADEVAQHFAAGNDNDPPLQTVFSADGGKASMDRYLKVLTYALASVFLVGPIIWAITEKAALWSQPNVESSTAQTASSPKLTRPDHLQANAVPLAMLESASREQPAENTTAADQSVSIQGLHQLSLDLSADSWVSITDGDGNRLEYDLLRGGSQRQYQGSGPFKVLIGRASAVQLKLNGEPVDMSADSLGNVANLTLDPESVSQH